MALRCLLRRLGAVLLAIAVAAPIAHAGAKCRHAPRRTLRALALPGPYAVGQRTHTFVDDARETPPNGSFPGASDRTLVTEVWFPATSPAGPLVDMADAPYPVVVHSHGFLDARLGMSYLTEHLASHGYVVVAVDYPLSNGGAPGGATIADVANQPGDLSFVLDRVLEAYAGAVDPETIGATGLSLGGLTTLLATYHVDLREPRIDAASVLAAPGCFFTRRFYRTTRTPLLVVHGDDDQLVPYEANGARVYRYARGPKHLVTLRDGSHTLFSVFGSGQSGMPHGDVIGCVALLDALADETDLPALGDERAGIDGAADCAAVCPDGIPEGISMSGTRQHELTRTAVLAFFDGFLKEDIGARCTLRGGIADVGVRAR